MNLVKNNLENINFADIDTSVNKYIMAGDELFHCLARSIGRREVINETSIIFYCNNQAESKFIKSIVSWKFTNDDNDEEKFKKFYSYINVIANDNDITLEPFDYQLLKNLFNEIKVNKSVTEVWEEFKKFSIKIVHHDPIIENKLFLGMVRNQTVGTNKEKIYLSLPMNPNAYDKDVYLESVNEILHYHWMASFRNITTIVNLNGEENFAGALYSKLNPAFCVLPFMHVQYKPSGQSKLCCRYDLAAEDKQSKIGVIDNLSNMTNIRHGLTIQKTSIEDTFNSTYWQRARDLAIDNKRISGCSKCYKEEVVVKDEIGMSMRMGSSIIYNEGYMHKLAVKQEISFLEVGFGNFCNLACLTCNSTLSTSWHKDDLALSDSPEFDRKVFPQLENLTFTPSKETLDSLRVIKFTGGEPMINPEFVKFIDHICTNGTPENISLEIYTNCSYIPSPKLLKNLSMFKDIQLNLSVDAYGEVNDFVRYGSKWSGEQKNSVSAAIEFWLAVGEENTNIHVILAPTLSVLNMFYIKDLIEWWNDKMIALGKSVDISESGEYTEYVKIQPAHEPKYISPDLLPKSYYDTVREWASTIVQDDRSGMTNCLRKIQRATMSTQSGKIEDAKLLLNYLEKMDKIRGTDARASVPLLVNQLEKFLASQDTQS